MLLTSGRTPLDPRNGNAVLAGPGLDVFDFCSENVELNSRATAYPVDIRQVLDVEWIAHPNWFYRVSKFALPFIHHPYAPAAFFLNEETFSICKSAFFLYHLFIHFLLFAC